VVVGVWLPGSCGKEADIRVIEKEIVGLLAQVTGSGMEEGGKQ
jgi:hypothetical protein